MGKQRKQPKAKQRSPRQIAVLAAGAFAVVVGGLILAAAFSGTDVTELSVSAFERKLAAGDVATAELFDRSNSINGELEDGRTYLVHYAAEYSDELTQQLLDAGIRVEVNPQGQSLTSEMVDLFLYSLLPIIIVLGALYYFISSMQGGGGRLAKFSKAGTRRGDDNLDVVTFADVAGADEAVEELQEIKDFLADPERFRAMGAEVPRGVLLFGPPGTGKTLLARAVAGEAGVPFFTISGSDFVEMFVGVGASRVRDLFRQAKQEAPSIVFVDEIDAVGRHRGAGVGGGHDEREQTLNQLLVELDGFDARSGVLLMAATNRPDILDPALLRPGRFDRQIVIDQPDLVGRTAILRVHAKGKSLADDIDLEVVARRTPGFTGADLANVLNEAALLAVRRGHQVVSQPDLADAVDRVTAGAERRSRVLSEGEKRVIAFHEAGHALIGHALPTTDPVHKVSIVSRGRALGWTLSLPTEDRYVKRRTELLDSITMLLGGRTAEELVFDDPSTGAADDIERATHVARRMVTEYGMSAVLGPRKLGHRDEEPFLGKEQVHQSDYSDEVAARIDVEINAILDGAHAAARAILTANRAALDRLAHRLIEDESVEELEIAELFSDVEPWDQPIPGLPASWGAGSGGVLPAGG